MTACVCHREARLGGPWRSSWIAYCSLLTAHWWLALPAPAHPVHLGTAHADYNTATGRLEISISLDADDAETALTRRAGRRITLEQTPPAELDALLHAWLAEKFLAVDRHGAPQPLLWVGRELKVSSPHYTLWLHCEVALPGGPAGARLAHLLLLDEFPRQENILRVRAGGRGCTLAFRRGDTPKPVAFP